MIKSSSKTKNCKSYGNFSTQMAGFQLAGPAADVSESLYGENRKSYQSPNAQYDNSGSLEGEAVKCSKKLHLVEENVI